MDSDRPQHQPTTVEAAVDSVYRQHWRKSVAVLLASCRDLALAEDCVQEAFSRALRSWAQEGIPENPGAWILVTARRVLIDHIRSRDAGTRAIARLWDQPLWQVELELLDDPENDTRDDELALMLLCCHPALAPTDQVLLMLRTVAGLTPEQIAPMFYSNEPGIRSRLTRAKRKIRLSRVPLRQPSDPAVADRLPQVLAAVRLAFTHGHRPGAATPDAGADLRREAIRLAQVLTGVSEEPDTWSLLALLMFTNERMRTRLDEHGRFIPLPNQVRTRWDQDTIATAAAALDRGRSNTMRSPYQLEAEISALHTTATSAEHTDWAQIVVLYNELVEVAGDGNAGTKLNRAIAMAEAGDHIRAATELERLDPDKLGGPWRLHAARAHLHTIAGDTIKATAAWNLAGQSAPTAALRDQLTARLGML